MGADTRDTRTPALSDGAVAADIVFAFLRALARNLRPVEERATPAACAAIFASLWGHLAAHIPHLAEALAGMRPAVGARGGPLRRWLGGAKSHAGEGAALEALARMSESDLKALAAAVVAGNGDSVAKAFAFVRALRGEPGGRPPVVFLTVGFPTTWAPLARELTRSGVRTYTVCLYDYMNSAETGVLNTTEIPVGEAKVLDFLGHLILLAAAGPASLLINSDSYYGANWEAERGTLLYLLTSAMLGGAREAGAGRGTLIALKYDAVQQIFRFEGPAMDRDPTDMLIGHLYRLHMTQFDRVVYNANSEIIGEFNENSIPLAIPRLHFYRYNNRPERARPRLDWQDGRNIHLVILSSFLGDFCNETRGGYADVVRAAIAQGIHVRYFCDVSRPEVAAFADTLPADRRDRFHPQAVIKDQQALVEEIQPYHVGLVLSDDTAFLRSIATLTDPFYRDATSALWQSTIGSSPFAFAGAGLPFICPRYMRGVQEVFGPDIAMPMTLSELRNLRPFLERCGLPRRLAAAEARRESMWIETNIPRLAAFIGEERAGAR